MENITALFYICGNIDFLVKRTNGGGHVRTKRCLGVDVCVLKSRLNTLFLDCFLAGESEELKLPDFRRLRRFGNQPYVVPPGKLLVEELADYLVLGHHLIELHFITNRV